jgi:agmatine deiminase
MRRVALSCLLLLCLLLLVAGSAAAQADRPPRPEIECETLPIYLTDEELAHLDQIGINHRATDPPEGVIRQCAEWEPVTGVLIRYSSGFGIPYSLIKEYAESILVHILCVSSQQTACYNNLVANGVNVANVRFLNVATNSIWTRDYGPQFVFSDGVWGIIDHIYNRPRPQDDVVNVALGTAWGCRVYGTPLTHTGGNYMCDGHGRGFSTDLVWDDNSGMSHVQIAQYMEDYLGITDYQVVPDISAYGIHHIDCWAKMLDEETILVKQVSPSHADYPELAANVAYLQTLTNCYGRPYNIVRVFCGTLSGSDVASYTNSLILNGKVFVPTFGISTDAAALATYQAAMPGYEVLGYSGSWYSDDAIHCRGMGVHDEYMLRVDTNRLNDVEENSDDYRVSAYIDDRSEIGLVADSLLVYWRLEGQTPWNAVVMSAAAYPDSYTAWIPQQDDSVDVQYYVFAKDLSGRREKRPIVAPGTWYTFNTGAGATATADRPVPQAVPTILSAFPNPANPVVTARYSVPQSGAVDLAVYSPEGRLVRLLVRATLDPGTYEAVWDGSDAAGRPVSSGVYFLRLVAGGEVSSKRVVVLK